MQREAKIARLIATAAVENVDRYVMMTKRSPRLWNAAIWGSLAALSAAAGYAAAGPYGAIVGTVASGFAASIAGDYGAIDFRGRKETQIRQRLEKKYLGLIQTRESQLESQKTRDVIE